MVDNIGIVKKRPPEDYLPKNNHVASADVPVETQLDRIERKLNEIKTKVGA